MLNDYKHKVVDKRDCWKLLLAYSRSQQPILPDGHRVPWIDENLNPYTGGWISRTPLSTMEAGSWSEKKEGRERGKDYNHSSFCDHSIAGLVGIRSQHDGNKLVVNPLLPDNTWDYFCLDRVPYHGKTLTTLHHKTGTKYGKEIGLRVFVNGIEKAASTSLQRVTITI